MTAAALPRRDEEARARLRAVAVHARPVTLARERALPVAGSLGELLPGAGLVRGTVVQVDGTPGAGATSVGFALAAAATTAGEWVAAVDLVGTLGVEAAAAAGVALERFPVVRLSGKSVDRWATVVAALLDGVGLVLTELPRHARPGDARRLVARARERGAVLVVLPSAADALARRRGAAPGRGRRYLVGARTGSGVARVACAAGARRGARCRGARPTR